MFQCDKFLPRHYVSALVSHALLVVIPVFGSKLSAATNPTLMVYIMIDIDTARPLLCNSNYPCHKLICCNCSFIPHMIVPLVIICLAGFFWLTDTSVGTSLLLLETVERNSLIYSCRWLVLFAFLYLLYSCRSRYIM